MKVVMVCTGNLCRSPMAEAMLRHAVRERDCDISVVSSGTWADHGNPATPEVVEVLQARGIDMRRHASRRVDLDELRQADLVIGMTSVHRREILELAPEVEPKLVLMNELVEIGLEGDLPDSTEARLERLLGAARPEWRRALDLGDPYGMPVGVYERTAAQIEIGIQALLTALCGPAAE